MNTCGARREANPTNKWKAQLRSLIGRPGVAAPPDVPSVEWEKEVAPTAAQKTDTRNVATSSSNATVVTATTRKIQMLPDVVAPSIETSNGVESVGGSDAVDWAAGRQNARWRNQELTKRGATVRASAARHGPEDEARHRPVSTRPRAPVTAVSQHRGSPRGHARR